MDSPIKDTLTEFKAQNEDSEFVVPAATFDYAAFWADCDQAIMQSKFELYRCADEEQKGNMLNRLLGALASVASRHTHLIDSIDADDQRNY